VVFLHSLNVEDERATLCNVCGPAKAKDRMNRRAAKLEPGHGSEGGRGRGHPLGPGASTPAPTAAAEGGRGRGHLIGPGASTPAHTAAAEKSTPKKKRKSPANPWKKPKDMPKRPLSAYNLFFKSEREQLIRSASLDTKPAATKTGKHKAESSSTKLSQTAGIGFANLAKTIAAKWKTLSESEKAPFEERAAIDKQRYDEAVAEWRLKKKKEEAAKPSPAEGSSTELPSSPEGMDASSSHSIEVEHLESPYPSEWFRAGAGGHSGHTAMGREPITDDSSRGYEHESYATLHSSGRSLEYQSQQASHGSLQLTPPGRSSIYSERLGVQAPVFGFSAQQFYREHPYTAITRTRGSLTRGGWHRAASEADMSSRAAGFPISSPLLGSSDSRLETLQPHEFALPLPAREEHPSMRRQPASRGSYPSPPYQRPPEQDDSYQPWGAQRSTESESPPDQQSLSPLTQLAMSSLSPNRQSMEEELLSTSTPGDLRAGALSRPPNLRMLRGVGMRSASLPVMRRIALPQDLSSDLSERRSFALDRRPIALDMRAHSAAAAALLLSGQQQQQELQQHASGDGLDQAAPSSQQPPQQQGDTVQHGTSLDSLTENLDDDTIDFITRLHFS